MFIIAGQYWGEMGYFRIETGHNSLGIEMNVVWATPGGWTSSHFGVEEYIDPSSNLDLIARRLKDTKIVA
jgi:hypothetical protein